MKRNSSAKISAEQRTHTTIVVVVVSCNSMVEKKLSMQILSWIPSLFVEANRMHWRLFNFKCLSIGSAVQFGQVKRFAKLFPNLTPIVTCSAQYTFQRKSLSILEYTIVNFFLGICRFIQNYNINIYTYIFFFEFWTQKYIFFMNYFDF